MSIIVISYQWNINGTILKKIGVFSMLDEYNDDVDDNDDGNG